MSDRQPDDSLMTTYIGWVIPMPILLTQEPIHEIFMKKYCELAELKNGHLNENKQLVHMRFFETLEIGPCKKRRSYLVLYMDK